VVENQFMEDLSRLITANEMVFNDYASVVSALSVSNVFYFAY
jgi:hypothetical protein